MYMSKFLKLTNFILNTNDIHRIVIHPNKYLIHIVSRKNRWEYLEYWWVWFR